MKTKTEIADLLKKHKNELERDYRIRKIGVFGSYSRGDQVKGSDIDILVELGDPLGLRYVQLARRLEEILGAKVDLVSRDAIKPRLWKYIEQDIVYA